jgi:1,4-dihydroxy-2-naphthoate octaprenyltransferase
LPKNQTQRQSIPVEADLVILSFLGHFSWELLQAPLFSSLTGKDHVTGILICLQATIGDVGIALAAFWLAALFGGGRGWASRPSAGSIGVFLATGLFATVGLEFLNTEILNRWSYGPNMPLLPVIGTGLSPMLQWLFVPTMVLWYLNRLSRHSN